MKEGYSERRRETRIEKKLPLKLVSSGDYDAITETKNISASGALCSLDKNIPEMTKLEVTLLIPRQDKLPPKKITCEGVIVRVQKDTKEDFYCTAIFFNKISKSDKKIIRQFVDSQASV